MIPSEIKPKSPSTKRLLSLYLIFLSILIIVSIITNNMSLNYYSIEFVGVWLLISEILLGFTAAGSMSILTTMSTLRATGKPITENNIIQQRLEEENQSFRKPWLLLLLINTTLLILSGLLLFH